MTKSEYTRELKSMVKAIMGKKPFSILHAYQVGQAETALLNLVSDDPDERAALCIHARCMITISGRPLMDILGGF